MRVVLKLYYESDQNQVVGILPQNIIYSLYHSNIKNIKLLTLKKSHVEPWYNVPYCTSDCDARSSGEFMGATIRSTVKKAAKLAV